MERPLRIAVIGGGAFGRNHLRVYSELSVGTQSLSIVLVEPDAARRAQLSAQFPVASFSSIADLLATGPVDAASICVPTVAHAAAAIQLLHAGADILIEKPFATSLAEADAVLALATHLGRLVAVGHLERFNPAVTACFDRLTTPMFFEAHRLSVFTPRSLDVDVVLDLMIHDLDIVLALCGCPVREVRAVGLPVLSGKVDIANARVEFSSGCIANLTASRVSTEQVRKLRLFQPHQYLSLDFARQELLSVDVDPGAPLIHLAEHTAARQAANPPAPTNDPASSSSKTKPHPSPGLNLSKAPLHYAEPLRLELENFLISVRSRTPPRVTGLAGRAALDLALEINREIRNHAKRAGLA